MTMHKGCESSQGRGTAHSLTPKWHSCLERKCIASDIHYAVELFPRGAISIIGTPKANLVVTIAYQKSGMGMMTMCMHE